MLKPNNEIRSLAREKLTGKWPISALSYFLGSLVIGLIAMIFYIPNMIFVFSNNIKNVSDNFENTTAYEIYTKPTYYVTFSIYIIGILIVSGILSYGLSKYFLKISNNEPADIGDVFEGFRKLKLSIKTGFLVNIRVFLWSLLLFIPGIIAGLRYSMTFFILIDNPEMEPDEAIKKSTEMMKGNKGKLFLLGLSFIGWFLLMIPASIITCGIGFIVFPNVLYTYYYSAFTEFYLDLKENSKNII